MTSPVVGYDTRVRHLGEVFRIQTEDCGLDCAIVVTCLATGDGRLIASETSSYARWIGTDECPAAVKRRMQEQHEAMFVALRDGRFADRIADSRRGRRTC